MFKTKPLIAAFKRAAALSIGVGIGFKLKQHFEPASFVAQNTELVKLVAAGLISSLSVQRYNRVERDMNKFDRRP